MTKPDKIFRVLSGFSGVLGKKNYVKVVKKEHLSGMAYLKRERTPLACCVRRPAEHFVPLIFYSSMSGRKSVVRVGAETAPTARRRRAIPIPTNIPLAMPRFAVINLRMKAAVLYGREEIRVEEVALSALPPGGVRIQIEAALTCGTDLKVFKRGYHARMIVPPAVFGHELAGVISEVHPEVVGWKKLASALVVANSAPCAQMFLYCAKRAGKSLQDDFAF